MGQIGEPISTSVPAVGTAGTAYASDINSLLTEFKTRLTAKVSLSSIDGTLTGASSLDMNNQPVQNAQYLGMYAQASAPSGSPNSRLASYNGNLYYVDTSGAVQITNGGNLNASGIGGITGDFGDTNPAAVSFVDGSERYEFYDNQSASEWANLKFKQWEAVEEGGNIITVIPGSPAANYTLTLPPNDPASGVSLLTLNNTGLMQLAETAAVSNAFTFSGVVTYTADPVLSGSTKVKHGDRKWQVPFSGAAVAILGSIDTIELFGWKAGNSSLVAVERLPVQVGWRVKSVTVRCKKVDVSSTTISLHYTDASGVEQSPAGASTATTTNGAQTVTVTPTTPITVTDNEFLYLKIDVGAALEEYYGAQIVYDVV